MRNVKVIFALRVQLDNGIRDPHEWVERSWSFRPLWPFAALVLAANAVATVLVIKSDSATLVTALAFGSLIVGTLTSLVTARLAEANRQLDEQLSCMQSKHNMLHVLAVALFLTTALPIIIALWRGFNLLL